MKCWHCKSDVIWGGDHSFKEYDLEGEGIVTNMSCSKCPANYLIYLGDEDDTSKQTKGK
tara:strand:+ start:618 stop:794 length:177 start_codon:yes stop_codon:yes gene_type:complete